MSRTVLKHRLKTKTRNLPETIDSNKGGHDCRIYRTATIGFNWEGTNSRPIMKHTTEHRTGEWRGGWTTYSARNILDWPELRGRQQCKAPEVWPYFPPKHHTCVRRHDYSRTYACLDLLHYGRTGEYPLVFQIKCLSKSRLKEFLKPKSTVGQESFKSKKG